MSAIIQFKYHAGKDTRGREFNPGKVYETTNEVD